ncbi:MAG TPA: helix-turn-helix domain-containing protein [Nocardioidaceae bacterium]|nr:helix-turn-helix domain-containing protein [Nocardioidaceae bacterium]
MQRADFSEMQCSVARTLDIIGDPWTPLVLRDIAIGVSRFDAIHRNLGLSRKVLTQRLNSLLEHEVVERTAYQDNPPRFDYTLTEKGTDLAMVLLVLQAYGDKHILGRDNAPVVWQHLNCGNQANPVVCCDQCGEQVRPGEAIPTPGPGFDGEAFPEISKAFDRIQQLLAAL